MIVISGALVLVALVLLIIGVVGPDLAFVYASIAVSLVSLVFLVVGILQRRGEPATAAEGADAPQPVTVDDPAEGVTVRPSSLRRVAQVEEPDEAGQAADEAPVASTVDEEPVAGGDVLVVEGRPRYHVVGCRYLSGKTPEAVEVGQARAEGFTPCGVCKPDVALAALAEEEAAFAPSTEELLLDLPTDEVEVEEAGPAPVVEEDVPGVEVAPAARRTASRAVARKTPASKTAPAAPAKTPAARRPAATRTAAVATPVAAAPVAAPARTASSRGSVVVIPDRGKYHREQCRYVRDVAGAEVLSKAAATRQGYAPCGVCKP